MAQRSYAKLCPTYPLCKMLVQLFGGYWSPPTCKAFIKSIVSLHFVEKKHN
ncbi:hypothetical protein LTR97_008681 [Elasticomyces elasticus]|uniref:Uncharacterized protein n=1 Tax=Elasticomyces elasticus TaxID=574655 RepID=A0AAN7WBQ8_9PEZI|nr:hypothetical protein LTR97_008681 [Elasticomyces elasticus]